MRPRTTQKTTRPIFPSATHFPEPVSEAAAIGHPHRPAKLDFLYIPADELSIFGRKSLEPLPDRLVATWRFEEECR